MPFARRAGLHSTIELKLRFFLAKKKQQQSAQTERSNGIRLNPVESNRVAAFHIRRSQKGEIMKDLFPERADFLARERIIFLPS